VRTLASDQTHQQAHADTSLPALWAARSFMVCIFLTIVCLLVAALGFFMGFSMFNATLSFIRTPTRTARSGCKDDSPSFVRVAARADIVCHFAGGLLLSIMVIQKAHYVYAWLIFPFFRCVSGHSHNSRHSTNGAACVCAAAASSQWCAS
jgi:hypothetical protein